MADPQFNPGMMYDPEDYLKAQRAQMVAEALQRFAFTPSDPQNVGRQQSRASPLSMIARVLAGKMTGGAIDQSMKAQMGMYGNLRNAQSEALGAPSTSGGSPGFFASADQGGGQPPTPGQPDQNDVYRRALQQHYTGIPDEVTKAYLANNAPTETVKTGQQLGVAPADVAAKQFGIEMRPGGALKLPGGHMLRNPNLSPNLEPVYEGDNLMGARAIPGSTEALAGLKGAETAAEVQNKYNVLPTAGGGSMVVGGPGSSSGGVRTPPRPNYFAAPAKPPTTQLDTARLKPIDFSSAPKINIPTGAGVNPVVKGRIDNATALDKELSDEFGNKSELANQSLNYSTEALKSLQGAEVGPASKWLTHNRALLSEVTGHPEWFKPESVANTLVLNKNLINKALTGARGIYGPRMTANEVMLQKNEASPSAEMTRAAIRSLITQANARDAYQIQMGEDYNHYVNNGGDPKQFKSWYAKQMPVSDFALRYSTPKEAIAELRAHPQHAGAFKEKFGWLPEDVKGG